MGVVVRGSSGIPDARRRPGCSGRGIQALLNLAAVAVVLAAVPAGGTEVPRRVRLRHRLVPGSVAVYTVRIETTPGGPGAGQTGVQTGRLTRMIFGEAQPGEATCAQMVELAPAALTATETQPEDGLLKESRPLPEAWVQFSTARVHLDRAPLAVPGRTAWSRQALSTVVRVTDWPGEPVSAGDGWRWAFRAGPIAGQQHYLVTAIERVDRDVVATLAMKMDFDPPADQGDRHVTSAEAMAVFSIRDRELVSLDGRVVWREAPEAGGREVTRRISIERTDRYRVASDQLVSERDAVSTLAYAGAAYQRKDYTYALQTLSQFRQRWPRSRWQPVAEHIGRLVRAEGVTDTSLTTDELEQALTRLSGLWEQARVEGDEEVRERCQSALANLTKLNRPELTRLLDASDVPLRASACFALGFGLVPADVALIQMRCADDTAPVRRAALAALALRASPLTDSQVLLKCLTDGDAIVRQRACEAISSCVPADSAELPAVRAGLADRLNDDVVEVVLGAARALMRLGSDNARTQVEQAAERAGTGPLRDALRKIVAGGDSP